jgi:hypothetical protein
MRNPAFSRLNQTGAGLSLSLLKLGIGGSIFTWLQVEEGGDYSEATG